jgi:hypothetical protein
MGVDLRPRPAPHYRNVLDVEDLDTPIFRIIPLERFYRISKQPN